MAKKTTTKAKNAAKKQPSKPKLLLAVIALTAAIVILVIGWSAASQLKYRSFKGTVTQIGLEGAAADAPVYYQVQVSEKKSQDVYLTVSPTPDHPSGTPLPDVKVGDKVIVHAKKGDAGASLVGTTGTYIKREQK